MPGDLTVSVPLGASASLSDGTSGSNPGFLSRAKMWQLWLRFVIVEHCVLSIRTVILILSPTIPRWVTDAEETLEYRRRYRYRTQVRSTATLQVVRKQLTVVDVETGGH